MTLDFGARHRAWHRAWHRAADVGARPFQVRRLLEHVRALDLSTPRESAAMVRDDRERR